ncbi:unnamed protein product [Prorocentrum cordatum]|uniref:Uncharacterized protein n=1 Tax=Prorocentrum cordatum TaxID=2364126 RepID=A0ABN9UWD3_9DINO|nr:unnamed protein product [Polarella glacialis]
MSTSGSNFAFHISLSSDRACYDCSTSLHTLPALIVPAHVVCLHSLCTTLGTRLHLRFPRDRCSSPVSSNSDKGCCGHSPCSHALDLLNRYLRIAITTALHHCS